MTEDSLRVVILTYGTNRQQEPLLAHLLTSGIEARRILLVHNPSTPGEPDPSVPEGCELLRAEHNLGYAAGMNLGIRRQIQHRPSHLLLLTHDARLENGALERLVDAGGDNRYGAVGPVLMDSNSGKVFSYGGLTRRNGTVVHQKNPSDSTHGVLSCDWIDGGVMLLRVEALRTIGGFDERFWSYCEEAELCLRLVRAGYRVGCVERAIALQEPGGPKRPGPWSYLITRNGAEYARLARGRLAMARFLLWTAHRLVLNFARAALRSAGLRAGSRSEPWAQAVGTFRGALDFFLRRWGPPPEGLPGMGDLSYTRQEGAPNG